MLVPDTDDELPCTTTWLRLFESLRYVDEVQTISNAFDNGRLDR